MKIKGEMLKLYAVTDRSWLNGRALKDDVRKALEGGATFLQFREKELDDQAFLREAREVLAVAREFQVPFIVNDRVELARDCGADGVHVGQGDAGISQAREILGQDKIIGASAHTVEEALAAERQGADYLGVGAVFGSATKKNVHSMSKETLRAICQTVHIPVVAIGGINRENVGELYGIGIDGIALVSAIFAEDDIKRATREMLQRVQTL